MNIVKGKTKNIKLAASKGCSLYYEFRETNFVLVFALLNNYVHFASIL